MRMPPGWDGVRTIKEIWSRDSRVEIVICTAFSDHSWSDLFRTLGNPEQLLILKSEDLFQDPAPLYEKVLDFLGLPPCDNVRFEKMNPGAYTELNPELRNRLESYFRPENEKLYQLLDVNLGWDKR